METDKIRRRSYAYTVLNFYDRMYFRDRFEKIKGGVWYVFGIPIARKSVNGKIEINWQDGELRRIHVEHRFRAIVLHIGQPFPLIERGWITLKLGSPADKVSPADAPRLARHIFYAESGYNVEESVFEEILQYQRGCTITRGLWVADNPKQGLIWDVCKLISVDWGKN